MIKKMHQTKKYGDFNLTGWRKSLLSYANKTPTNWLGRRLSLLLRKAVLKSLPEIQHCIDAKITGINMRVHIKDNVSERKFLFMPQFFDPFERQFIHDNLPKDGVFVDIGANAGIYSLTAAKQLENNGKVISIEPHPKMAMRLSYNISLNNAEHKIQVLQYAITAEKGVMSLMLDDSNMGGNSLTQKRGDNSIEVNCIPLHDLLQEQEISHIDILKIDIEGAEDTALIPFFNKTEPSLYPRFIIMENSKDQWQEDLEGKLFKAGYSIIHTSAMNCIWSI